MNLSIPCPSCRKAYQLPASLVGKTVRCVGCKAEFVVPPEERAVRPGQAPPALPTVEPVLTPPAAAGTKVGGRGLLLVLLLAGGALTAFATLVVLVGLIGLWLYLGSSPTRPADQAQPVVPAAEAPAEDAPWEPKLKPAHAPRDLRDLPRPVDGGAELAAPPRAVKDIDVRPLRLAGLLPCLCWSSDATSFFAATGEGVVRRVALAGFLEQKRLDVGRKVSWLSPSAEGLLVTLPEVEEVWVLDPDTLALRRRLAAPGGRVVSAPGLSVAITAATVEGPLVVLDLKTGATREYSTEYFRGTGFDHLTCSPDGRHVFAAGLGKLHRFKVQGTKLTLDESSFAIAEKALTVNVSPDSRYVCLPAPLGNAGHLPGHAPVASHPTYVYEAENFKRPAFTLAMWHPGEVGFDPKTGFVFTQNRSQTLVVFDGNGVQQKEYAFGRTFDRVRQFLVHPGGGKLFAVLLDDDTHPSQRGNPSQTWWIDLSDAGGATPALPGNPDLVGKQTGASLRSRNSPKRANGLSVTQVLVNGQDLVPSMCWTGDGKHFFCADNKGVVRRVAVPELKEEVRIELGRRCSGLAVSAEGLLAVLPDDEEVWLLDPGRLAVKKRFPVAGAKRVLSAASLSVAFAVSLDQFRDTRLTALELKRGRVLGPPTVKPSGVLDAQGPGSLRELTRKAGPFPLAEVSADGRYLFGAGGGCLHRFRIEGAELSYVESSAPLNPTEPVRLQISVDSKWVCLPPRASRSGPQPVPEVFAVENLKKSFASLQSTMRVEVFAADPATGMFYVQDGDGELVVFNPQGARTGWHTLGEARFGQRRGVQQFLVRPEGGKLLVLTREALYWVELPGGVP